MNPDTSTATTTRNSTATTACATTPSATTAMTVAGPAVVAGAVVVVAELSGPVELVVIALGVAAALWATLHLVVSPLVAQIASARRTALDAEAELIAERSTADVRERLERALRVSESEPTTLRTGLRAVAELAPDTDVSLLLNLPDEPRVGWRIQLADGALETAQQVPDRPSCAALSSGRTAVSRSSAGLDACAHLHAPDLEVSSICVPLRLGERLLGSVCVQGPAGELPDQRTIDHLEWAVDRMGVRAAEQRLQRGPSTHAPVDPVTGLPGTSALRTHLRDLVRSLIPFCVAVIEPDGSFDAGAATGVDHQSRFDDDLRLLGDVLCATLRPDDLVCRLGGQRLAAVLTQCSADQATSALERARESMVLTVAEVGGAPVTTSAGVVESHRVSSLEELIDEATAACHRAGEQGGNRVMVAGEQLTTEG